MTDRLSEEWTDQRGTVGWIDTWKNHVALSHPYHEGK